MCMFVYCVPCVVCYFETVENVRRRKKASRVPCSPLLLSLCLSPSDRTTIESLRFLSWTRGGWNGWMLGVKSKVSVLSSAFRFVSLRVPSIEGPFRSLSIRVSSSRRRNEFCSFSFFSFLFLFVIHLPSPRDKPRQQIFTGWPSRWPEQ